MIKIGPLFATDYEQVCSLLGLQEEPALEVPSLTESGLVLRSLSFWQHWMPCQFHMTPSIYVAREERTVLGFISLHTTGSAKTCWRVDNLVVHPSHRGRGIAQELLRYIFAQFGSQGVSHFIAEVSGQNDAALSLFAAGGFCRSAQVTYYKLTADAQTPLVQVDQDLFSLATPLQRYPLFQLHLDCLPPDLRLVLSLSPEDFTIKEIPPFTSVEMRKNRIRRKRTWFWTAEDPDRRSLTAAARITAIPNVGYRLDFAIHPGWKQLTAELVNHAVNSLLQEVPLAPIWVRVYDFQPEVHEALKLRSFERIGDYFLLSREHWQRAKHPRKRKADATVTLKPISNPALNFPLVTERSRLDRQRDLSLGES